MHIVQSNLHSTSPTRRPHARSFAHHYGGIRRIDAPDRALRVYPPLGWGVGQVMPHVRRAPRASDARFSPAPVGRGPLAL